MAAKSKHYGDLIIWIESVINSCTNLAHLRATDKLIDLFGNYLEYATNMDIFDRMNIIRSLRIQQDAKEFDFYERKFDTYK